MTTHATRALRLLGVLTAAGSVVVAFACKPAERVEPGTFATPQEASTALASLAGSGDEKRTEEMFGPGSVDLFRTGDPAEDKSEAQRVKDMMTAKVAFDELDANTQVLLLGNEGWPFPIPLVRAGDRWRFDTAAGRGELLNRRVGYYELATLESLHEYVDAQHEYQAEGHDGAPRAFAQRFFSTEGKHDGLYWPPAEGEPESPLGDLLAKATDDPAISPEPFRGYFYRILEAQGAHAPGGGYSYLDKQGRMTLGFAAIAWPAKYGNSGVKTFLVNQRGIVYEKDLGAETDSLARAVHAFDPDASWQITPDTLRDYENDEAGEPEPAPGQPAQEGAPATGS
jgi:DUF2950 family protein